MSVPVQYFRAGKNNSAVSVLHSTLNFTFFFLHFNQNNNEMMKWQPITIFYSTRQQQSSILYNNCLRFVCIVNWRKKKKIRVILFWANKQFAFITKNTQMKIGK